MKFQIPRYKGVKVGIFRISPIALPLSDRLSPKKGTSILVRVAKLLRLSIYVKLVPDSIFSSIIITLTLKLTFNIILSRNGNRNEFAHVHSADKLAFQFADFAKIPKSRNILFVHTARCRFCPAFPQTKTRRF